MTAGTNSPRFRTTAGPDGAVTVTADGDIDLATVDSFRAAMDEAAERATGIVVDLTGVTYCDSAGVRALFSVAAHTGLTLRVRGSGPLKKLLDISGLDRVTTVELTA